ECGRNAALVLACAGARTATLAAGRTGAALPAGRTSATLAAHSGNRRGRREGLEAVEPAMHEVGQKSHRGGVAGHRLDGPARAIGASQELVLVGQDRIRGREAGG